MKHNIIKYWNRQIFFTLAIINLIIMIIYIVLGAIFIETMEQKLINTVLFLLINLIYLAILYGFSTSNSCYETVYQIRTGNKGYDPKLYRYILILLGFLWLTFFILVAFYMFAEAVAYQNSLDYFFTLKKNWWKILIISFYSVTLIAIHRQILWYTINNQKLPWEKLIK